MAMIKSGPTADFRRNISGQVVVLFDAGPWHRFQGAKSLWERPSHDSPHC